MRQAGVHHTTAKGLHQTHEILACLQLADVQHEGALQSITLACGREDLRVGYGAIAWCHAVRRYDYALRCDAVAFADESL